MVTVEQRKISEKKHGEKIANNAEMIWGWGTSAGKIRADRRFYEMINFFSNKNMFGAKIVEIGCGTGVFSEKLRTKFPDLLSADISFDLLKKQKTQSKKLFVMDVEKTAFKQRTIDAVIGSSILHHLDIDKIFPVISEMLKPKGKLIFAEPNMLNPQILIQKNIPFIKKMLGDTPDETAFIRFTLEKKLRQYGFSNIQIRPFDFLHPFIPCFLIKPILKLQNILEKLPIAKEIAGSLIIYAEK